MLLVWSDSGLAADVRYCFGQRFAAFSSDSGFPLNFESGLPLLSFVFGHFGSVGFGPEVGSAQLFVSREAAVNKRQGHLR